LQPSPHSPRAAPGCPKPRDTKSRDLGNLTSYDEITGISVGAHSAATHLGENNVSLQTITAKTRHRNPRTAMRYIHLSAQAVAEELLDLGRHHR
jgi:hypothetical protein